MLSWMPSPFRSHDQLVILPVDWSVNCTAKGATPLKGVAVKSASGKGWSTTIKSALVMLSEPSGPVAVSVTE